MSIFEKSNPAIIKRVATVLSFFKDLIPILIFIIIAGLIYNGCKSLHVYNDTNQPADCNDYYTVMDYSIKMRAGEGLVGKAQDRCIEARKAKDKKENEDRCQKKIYGDNPIDRDDYKKHNLYLECLKD